MGDKYALNSIPADIDNGRQVRGIGQDAPVGVRTTDLDPVRPVALRHLSAIAARRSPGISTIQEAEPLPLCGTQ
jgi:hypothetical protein